MERRKDNVLCCLLLFFLPSYVAIYVRVVLQNAKFENLKKLQIGIFLASIMLISTGTPTGYSGSLPTFLTDYLTVM